MEEKNESFNLCYAPQNPGAKSLDSHKKKCWRGYGLGIMLMTYEYMKICDWSMVQELNPDV